MDETKTSNSFWIGPLILKLRSLARNPDACLAIVGIGNELSGDDAAGIQVIRKLKMQQIESPRIRLIEGGSIPENITAPLRRFSPRLVVLIDAADFGASPGQIGWIEPETISGQGFSSHNMPLSLLCAYLSDEVRCEVILLGIQPEAIEFDTPVSALVGQAVDQVVAGLSSLSEILA